MRRATRRTAAVLCVVAVVVALTGCSILDSLYDDGPPRDSSGNVTETKVVPATTLLEGDCFSFLPDGTLENVTAIPCTDEHTHRVIGQGELTAGQVEAAGGMQNAVSAACAEPFDTFRATLPEGTKKPDQEFLVANLEHDGKTWSAYSCVATDGALNADG